MRSIFFVALTFFIVEYSYANPFVQFEAAYEVINSRCQVNQKPSSENCSLEEIEIAKTETNDFVLIEKSDDDSDSYSLFEREQNSPSRKESAGFESWDEDSAIWNHYVTIYRNSRAVDREHRSVIIRSDARELYYTFFYSRKKRSMRNLEIVRTYHLRRK